MKQRSLVVDRFGVWLRVYLGGTAWLRRLVFWNTGMSRGVTLRFGEDKGGDHANCLGVQWRRSRRAAPSTEPAPMPEELCPDCEHPVDWHRFDDSTNERPADPNAKLHCYGYDVTLEYGGPPWGPGRLCDCTEYSPAPAAEATT
jgi:hypothetical protein